VEHHVATGDGRHLQVTEAGVPHGSAVFVHMGIPNSRLPYEPWVRAAERQGIRLISYDRPGYGDSDRDPGRSVASCAQDVRTIAETLGIEQMAMHGWSGGGPHALACAALLGDLVAAVAVRGSFAPPGAEGLEDAEDGDSEGVATDPAAWRAELERERAEMLAATPETMVTALQDQGLLSAADRDALTPELAGYLCEVGKLGLAQGADGYCDDWMAIEQPWGFEIDQIRTPVLVLHGRQDHFVPFAHGEWLAAHVPDGEAWLSDEDGHLTLGSRIESVLEWLLKRMR
jgi:pimeloyl-ACP methyl ester carboxylesterase